MSNVAFGVAVLWKIGFSVAVAVATGAPEEKNGALYAAFTSVRTPTAASSAADAAVRTNSLIFPADKKRTPPAAAGNTLSAVSAGGRTVLSHQSLRDYQHPDSVVK